MNNGVILKEGGRGGGVNVEWWSDLPRGKIQVIRIVRFSFGDMNFLVTLHVIVLLRKYFLCLKKCGYSFVLPAT